ncbi:MAG: NAD-dependent epimerase/dehydratase family protein [Legionellales bacterium]
MFKSFFLVGGAGFIGSHFIDAYLKDSLVQKVTVYDNFSTGKEAHYQQHLHDARFSVVRGEIASSAQLTQAMQGHDVVMHFASNADISKAIASPSIDFHEGIFLTHQVLESARLTGVKRLLYTSGSGVYGDVGDLASSENQGNMHPISTYGASKLAGEAYISSYCHMFGLSACIFRFANVVGPRQTHGVGYDFVNSLSKNQSSLHILGDGSQSKSYIYIQDIVRAVLLANETMQGSFEVYNVATNDAITVYEIAQVVVACMGLENQVSFTFTGGDRGWKGDVPVVRLNTDKMRSLGWDCKYNSEQAITAAAYAMLGS